MKEPLNCHLPTEVWVFGERNSPQDDFNSSGNFESKGYTSRPYLLVIIKVLLIIFSPVFLEYLKNRKRFCS